MRRRRAARSLAVVLVVLLAAAGAVIAYHRLYGPIGVTAYFADATAVYPGDEVRVAGVRVGTIESITPHGDEVKISMSVDRSVPIPADAKAVLVAQNLISARYVQLTPVYEDRGPVMADGAVIPRERTAVPVEWDEVKTQLMRLATDLGPTATDPTTSVSRFLNSAATALDGNGDKLRRTLAELSGAARILAGSGGDVVAVVKNLQTFVSALRDSQEQIVTLQNRLANVTSVVDDGRSDLDAALTDLSTAVGDVQRFVAGSRNQTTEQVQRLSNVTQNLVDNKMELENLLHLAPTGLSNFYNIYNPDTGSPIGSFVFNNLSNPTAFLCGMIGAVEDATSSETAKLCSTYLGPLLKSVSLNTLPVPIDPYLAKSPDPSGLIYSDPALAPGGAGPSPVPPEQPPTVSAYDGAAPGVAPFTGRAPGETPPGADPGLPPTTGTTLPKVLLPSTAPPSQPQQGPPPTDGAPS